ncbi:unnamed protein product, partial [Symbiodinium sp. CCMP2456]
SVLPPDTQLEPMSLTKQVQHMWATSLQKVGQLLGRWRYMSFDNNAGCPRRRLQLRAADGSLQTHEAEFDQIIKYFRALYEGPETAPPRLSQDLLITSAEILEALERFKPSKAMPSVSAPAALWKWFRQDIAPQLELHFARHLHKDSSSLPRSWCTSELVLLPKPGKPMRTPAHLRPGPCVSGPDPAYVAGRTLAQALERVIGHCASVRRLVQANVCNIHGKRYGHTNAKLYGGCHLSLDISCAYDHVPWEALQSALQFAAVPQPLIEAILLVHHTARLSISHCGLTQEVPLKRGLRQGCGLSPLLWAVYCGWLLHQMHDPEILDIHRANTSYADDLHFGWTILCGGDLERAYAAMKHVLTHLLRQGLTISQDKTVIVLELQGPQAHKALDRYTVQRPTGRHFRFIVDDKVLYLKIVSQHVYLGAVIGFRKFEQDTFKHRLSLARNSFSRLSVILRNRTVPLKLRLQLWQGCIWPAMLHSLDCTGLPLKEFQSMQSQLVKQARSIAKSHSMLTKETNSDFVRRLGLPDPVARMQQAPQQRAALDPSLPAALAPGEAQLQWRGILRGHLFDAASCWSPEPPEAPTVTPPKASLLQVTKVLHEIFCCEECGQQFSTQASLRRHVFCHHLSEVQQQQRQSAAQEAIKGAEMAHAKDGMPQCKHCLHAFSTWHAFNYHVNTRSCEIVGGKILPFFRQFRANTITVLNAITGDAHLRSCIGVKKPSSLVTIRSHFVNMFGDLMAHRQEMNTPTELMMATQELNFLQSMTHQAQHPRAMEWSHALVEDDDEELQVDHPPKSQGGQPGKGRGPKRTNAQQASPSRGSWPSNRDARTDQPRESHRRGQQQRQDPGQELTEMRSLVNMLSRLVLRQEAQQTILRQDSGFMLFIQARTQGNLAQELHKIGQAWHTTKKENPEALRAPMRVVLYQHFLSVVKAKFSQMLSTPSSRSTAEGLGWTSATGEEIYGIKWDPAQQTHVRDTSAPVLTPQEVNDILDKLIVAAPQPLVVQRFHASRPLAAEYESPVVSMFMEIGLRTQEAQATWLGLHRLVGSSVWAASGCYLRHERMKMSALAQKISSLTKSGN